MFKKLFIAFICIAIMLSTVSCTMFLGTTLKYLNALNNTQKANSMQSTTKYNVSIDLSKATQDVKDKFEKYKDIKLNLDESIDNKNKKGEISAFVSTGENMIDSKIYIDGDNMFMKVPFTDKYFKMTPSEYSENTFDTAKSSNEEYKKVLDEIGGVWKDAVENEIVTSEGSTVEHTPDGDVKVSTLSLELTDEKSKNILSNLADIVSKSDILKKQVIENAAAYGPKNDPQVQKSIEDWFKNLSENMKTYKDKYTLEKLKLTAKIDKDSYIIDETLDGTLVIKYKGEIKINFSLRTTRWNINSAVKINIPKISKEDIIDVKDSDFNNSEFFKKFKEDINKK